MLRAEREKLVRALSNFDNLIEDVKIAEMAEQTRSRVLKSTNAIYGLLNDVIQNTKVTDEPST